MAAETQDMALQENEAVNVNLISPKQRVQLLSLIGRKYIINCLLDGVETKALWDTGSQVCLINEKWRQRQIPHVTVRDLAEIVDPDLLNAHAVNQTPIPFSGWVEITFKLPSETAKQLELLVPVLVSDEDGVAEQPIIGYNVIEHVLARGIEPPCDVTEAVSAAFSFDCKKTEVFLKVMRSGDDGLGEGMVKAGREVTSIPAGQTRTVKCSVRAGTLPDQQDVLFDPCPPIQLPEGLKMEKGVVRLQRGSWSRVTIPVTNNTTHDILLHPRTILGQTQRVKTICPADTKPVEVSQTEAEILKAEQTPAAKTGGGGKMQENKTMHEGEHSWDPPVPLSHLPLEQQQQVRQLLREECGAFAWDEQDVGTIPCCRLRFTSVTPHL